MVEPKSPPRHALADEADAGFPPLRGLDHSGDGEGDDDDDLERDFHEDGGGD